MNCNAETSIGELMFFLVVSLELVGLLPCEVWLSTTDTVAMTTQAGGCMSMQLLGWR